MHNPIVQQEILLLIGDYLHDDFFPKGSAYDLLSMMEKAELACWNGLLDKILPEVIQPDNMRLFIIQVQKARNSLYIDLCHRPVTLAKEHSIDPYFLLDGIFYN